MSKVLELINVGKIYNSNDVLTIGIRNINVSFSLNEFVVIKGESGSGKSTLLNVIGANDTYEEGEILFNSNTTSHFNNQEWDNYRQTNIACIFQDFNIIENLTVIENIELALLRLENKKEKKAEALKLCEMVGLSKQKNQKCSQLSGGEKQRCVIARALAKDSPILLADEPTGNLDVKNSKEIAALLKEISKNKLVIVVTHNPEFFDEYSTREIIMSDGSILSDIKTNEFPETSYLSQDIEQKSNKTIIKEAFNLAYLNYKSKPKLSGMLTICIVLILLILFLIISTFNNNFITPLKNDIINNPSQTKAILYKTNGEEIKKSELKEILKKTNAKYIMLDANNSGFYLDFFKKDSDNKLSNDLKILFTFDLNIYLNQNKAYIIAPYSEKNNMDYVVNKIKQSQIGINEVDVKYNIKNKNIIVYLNPKYFNTVNKIKSITSSIKFNNIDYPISRFIINESVNDNEINIINSTIFDIENKNIKLSINDKNNFIVSQVKNDIYKSKNIVEINSSIYNKILNYKLTQSETAVVFYDKNINNKDIAKLDDFIIISSTEKIPISNIDEIFIKNSLYFFGLIGIILFLCMIMYFIFNKSINTNTSNYVIYKTLGIDYKISSLSTYFQMFFMYISVILFLPIFSILISFFPGSSFNIITFGIYLLIETIIGVLLFTVSFNYNKRIKNLGINNALKRGNK